MDEQTPLEEVVQHLPPVVATVLLEQSQGLQVRCLTGLRSFIAHLEEADVTLDPISFAEVLKVHAMTLLGMSQVIDELHQCISDAKLALHRQESS